MAQASPRGKARPISPHLQIWRWGPAMAASILHRVTGNGLAVAGLGVLVWWLGALASGPEAYAAFMGHATSWYGLVVLVGISWTYFGHIASGLRHYVLDTGAGFGWMGMGGHLTCVNIESPTEGLEGLRQVGSLDVVNLPAPNRPFGQYAREGQSGDCVASRDAGGMKGGRGSPSNAGHGVN